MIRVAIVEDDAAEQVKLKECLNFFSEQEHVSFEIDSYPSGTAFVMSEMKGYDIVLMDIDMPGMNGLETARALRKEDPYVILIFVTNMAQYAISGYDVDALSFILKPVNQYSFAIKMKQAVARTVKRNDDTVQVKKDGVLYMIPASKIKYLEVTGHYVVYHTEQGDFSEYSTLKEARKKVNVPYLAQCNQSFLINLKYITSMSRDKVTVDGNEIYISRKMRSEFLKDVTDFLGGKKQ